jgi:drug/metabolite transporter (DMT)-like permease
MHNKSSPPISPLIVILFGILAVSTSSIFIRYAQREAPSLVIAAGRLTMAVIILAPFALIRQRKELAGLRRKDLLFALLSGIFLAIHFAAWISSLEYTSVASSVVLVSTSPLWVALLSPIILKESITKWIVAGLSLALVGSVVVGISDVCGWNGGELTCPPFSDFVRGQAFLGDILALIGAFMGAGYILIGRQLRARISLTGYIFLVYGMAALVLLSIMLLAGQSLLGYSVNIYLLLLLLAIVPQLLGHSSFNWALGYLSAAYVSITLLGEPVGSTILAYFILQESPGVIKIIGAILILAGILLASKKTSSQNALASP